MIDGMDIVVGAVLGVSASFSVSMLLINFMLRGSHSREPSTLSQPSGGTSYHYEDNRTWNIYQAPHVLPPGGPWEDGLYDPMEGLAGMTQPRGVLIEHPYMQYKAQAEEHAGRAVRLLPRGTKR